MARQPGSRRRGPTRSLLLGELHHGYRKAPAAAALLGTLVLVVSCGPGALLPATLPTAEQPLHLRIAAVPGAGPLLEACFSAHQAAHPTFSWEWIPQSSERALQSLHDGRAQVALVDLSLLYGPTTTLAFRVPLLVIVHPDNRLSDVPAPAVAALLSGRAEEWAQVGGDPGPVHVYLPPDHAGEARAFVAQALGNRALAGDGMVCMTPESLVAQVADDRYGIGLVPGTVALSGVRALRVNGCLPSEPCYPWWIEYWLVWDASLPEPLLRATRSTLASCPLAPRY